MKKSLFILPLFAAALTACIADEPGQNNANGPKESSFISIRLANSMTTRADEANAGVAGNYEDGIASESTVNTIRFYFFKANGDPMAIDAANSQSYIDVSPTSSASEPSDPNITSNVTAVAKIETDGVNFPAQLVAVVNPTAALNDNDETKPWLNMPTLSQLNEQIISDFSSIQEGFVMSNSVYATGTSPEATVVETVPLSSANFYTASDAALANPVVVHVERVLAKVSLTSSLEQKGSVEENGINLPIYATLNNSGQPYNFEDQQIYVKFLGWNVTTTTATSYLMKNINPNWKADLFGVNQDGVYEPWNWPSYFRCFWAINPTGVTYNNYNFGLSLPDAEGNVSAIGDGKGAAAVKGFANGDTSTPANYTYLQENAASGQAGEGAENPSQIIVAAQLCKLDGTPITMAEWAFHYYTVGDLKTALLSALQAKGFKKSVDGGEATFINADDITFATTSALGRPDEDRYYVYAVLTPEASADNVTWTQGTDNTSVSYTVVNAALAALGHAKIWNNGYTYYYVNIEHLGATSDDPGYYGVVRNHVYNATVNSLVGLGTPVYDPTEEIIPEHPSDEDTYIAAVIKVLSWRIVAQTINFAW